MSDTFHFFVIENTQTGNISYFGFNMELPAEKQEEFEASDEEDCFIEALTYCEQHGVLDLNGRGDIIKYTSYEQSDAQIKESCEFMREWYVDHGQEVFPVVSTNAATAKVLGLTW